MYICNCIVHVSRYIILYHCKLFVFMFLLCFRALSTQQGGYVRATNLYYYYYHITSYNWSKKEITLKKKPCNNLGFGDSKFKTSDILHLNSCLKVSKLPFIVKVIHDARSAFLATRSIEVYVNPKWVTHL